MKQKKDQKQRAAAVLLTAMLAAVVPAAQAAQAAQAQDLATYCLFEPEAEISYTKSIRCIGMEVHTLAELYQRGWRVVASTDAAVNPYRFLFIERRGGNQK